MDRVIITDRIATRGTFKSVRLVYNNHFDEVVQGFLGAGWAVKSDLLPDYKSGQYDRLITFEAGEGANEVLLDLPNAGIV